MSSIYRSSEEKMLKGKVARLFEKWSEAINSSKNLPKDVKESFVTDGFYPGYLKQKDKVLFLGRESLSVEGDFMECLYNAYREGYVGGKHINKYQMHYLQFYIAFGFNHSFCAWKDIPFAQELAAKMGDDDGLSFAFINASKFSNWSENWQLDGKLVSQSLSASREGKYLARQIEILHPDVICSMNALGLAGDQLGEYEYIKELSNHDLAVHDYKFMDGSVVPLFDMWHFSAPRKSPFDNYYKPIADIYKKLCSRYPSLACR